MCTHGYRVSLVRPTHQRDPTGSPCFPSWAVSQPSSLTGLPHACTHAGARGTAEPDQPGPTAGGGYEPHPHSPSGGIALHAGSPPCGHAHCSMGRHRDAHVQHVKCAPRGPQPDGTVRPTPMDADVPLHHVRNISGSNHFPACPGANGSSRGPASNHHGHDCTECTGWGTNRGPTESLAVPNVCIRIISGFQHVFDRVRVHALPKQTYHLTSGIVHGRAKRSCGSGVPAHATSRIKHCGHMLIWYMFACLFCFGSSSSLCGARHRPLLTAGRELGRPFCDCSPLLASPSAPHSKVCGGVPFRALRAGVYRIHSTQSGHLGKIKTYHHIYFTCRHTLFDKGPPGASVPHVPAPRFFPRIPTISLGLL